MSDWLLNPWVHYVSTLIHISAALFWMGWIVFIFLMLIPVVHRTMPDQLNKLMPALKARVRKTVFVLILLIVLTGLHNMYYRGLFDGYRLWNTQYGQRFLVKLGAALIVFGIYVAAPWLTSMDQSDHDGASSQSCCAPDDQTSSNVMGVVLHLLAFTCGMLAALIGISL